MRCPYCRTDFVLTCHAHPPPSRPRQDPECVVFSRKARPENGLRIVPPVAVRCRHVSHAARIATPFGCCKPAVLSAVSSCRRFEDQRPRPPPLIGPRPPFNRLAASRKSGSEAVPKDRPRCRLCSGQGIRSAGYPAHLRIRHSAAEPHPPRRPRSGLPPQSQRRGLSAENRCAK